MSNNIQEADTNPIDPQARLRGQLRTIVETAMAMDIEALEAIKEELFTLADSQHRGNWYSDRYYELADTINLHQAVIDFGERITKISANPLTLLEETNDESMS